MSEVATLRDEEISVLALGTILVRQRWRVARWMFGGLLLAGLLALRKTHVYVATASFVPQGADASRSGLASLAGQFGVSLPVGSQSQGPDFYVRLLKSRVILDGIARDTFTVAEKGGQRIALVDLYEIKGDTPELRYEGARSLLDGIVGAGVAKTSGSVDLSATTKWPSVSLAIATALVDEVNKFNQRTRQGQAAGERKFGEGRVAIAERDLRDAENQLQQFMASNRQLSSSSQAALEGDRLRRTVSMRQTVYTSLMQALEEARLREVRDTPVITVIEPPAVPSTPEPLKRLADLELGLILGAFVGVLIIVGEDVVARRRASGGVELEALLSALQEVRTEVMRPFRRSGRGAAR